MRLQLIACCGLCITTIAQAEDTTAPAAPPPGSAGRGRIEVYIDPDLLVLMPQAQVTVTRGEDFDVDGGWTANVISGATPLPNADGISSATSFSEVRHALEMTFRGRPKKAVTLAGSWSMSAEPDYVLGAGGFSFSAETPSSMAVLSLAGRLTVDRAGTVGGGFADVAAWSPSVDLGWNQILGPTTKIDVRVTGQWHACGEALGCQSSPYRLVPLRKEEGSAWFVRERHPARRGRVAAGVRLSQALGDHLALHAGVRGYADSWWVLGVTGDAALVLSVLGDRLLLRGEGRLGWQSAASFYRDLYEAPAPGEPAPAWVSGDRELSGVRDAMAGGRVEWAIFGLPGAQRLAFTLRAAHLWFRWPRFSELPARDAWIVGGGFHVEH